MAKHRSLSQRMYWGALLPCLLDSLVLFVVAFMGSGLWFNSLLHNMRLTLPLATLFACLLSGGYFSWQLARRRRRQKAIEAEAFRLWLCNRIVHGSPEDYRQAVIDLLQTCRQYVYLPAVREPFLRMSCAGDFCGVVPIKRHPDYPVDAQTLMDLVDMARGHRLRRLMVVCSSTFDEPARAYARCVTDPTVELLDSRDLAAMAWEARQAPPEGEMAGFWHEAREQVQAVRRRGRSFSSWTRPARFLACGAVLVGLSFLTPFPGWYLAMAALCGVLAALSWALGRRRTAQSR